MDRLALLRGLGLGSGALAAGVFTLGSMRCENSPPRQALAAYAQALGQEFKRILVFLDAGLIVIGQLAAAYVAIALSVLRGDARFLFVLPGVVVLPLLLLQVLRERRARLIEQQTPQLALSLANALRATPSVADALRMTTDTLPEPLRSELLIVQKEMRLGATFESALLDLGKRARCRALDTVLAAVVVGTRLGGALPKVLETTASSLRELQRLDANMLAKTAPARAQMKVVGFAPFALVGVMYKMQPTYFQPLFGSTTGKLVAFAGLLLWAGAVLVGRQIMSRKL
jgi:tight adherence protein B